MKPAEEPSAPARRTARLAAMALAASAALVPAAMAGDGYIESDGTQFINTGYHVNPSSKVELDFAFVDFADTSAYVQSRIMDNHPTAKFPNLACTLYVAGTAGTGNFTLAIATGDRNVEGSEKASNTLVGNWTSLSGHPNPDGRAKYCDSTVRTVSIDETTRRMSIVENGEEVWYLPQNGTFDATYTAIRPLILFGRPADDAGTASDYRSKARIYGFRIYEKGELVHDYVPALKGGEAGLYDTKGGGFLPNARAEGNALAHGGDIRIVPDDGYVSTSGNDGGAGRNLYFDTAYTPNDATRVELDFALADDYTGQEWWVMGSHGNGYFGFYLNSSAAGWSAGQRWKAFSPALSKTTSVYAKDVRRTVSIDMKNLSAPASVKTAGLTNAVSSSAGAALSTVSSYASSLKIGARGNGNAYAPIKIYGLKIYENDAVLRSYKPYVKNGIPSLLDTAGTGGFISAAVATNALNIGYGGLIDSDAASRDACVETDGTQYIDLGCYAQSDTRFELDCSLLQPDFASDQYLFGTHGGYKAGNFPFSMYVIKNGKGLGWNCQTNNSNYSTLTSTRITAERQKFVLDAYGNAVSVLAADGTTLYTKTITHNHANARSPYELAVCVSRGKEGTTTVPVKLRIYSARIYESGILKHEFVPYAQDGVVGFWDTADNVFRTAANSGANPLALSGQGVDGVEKWLKSEPATAQVSESTSATLTAAAAGAIRYKWTLNGEEIAGATGETCTATWRQGDYNTPDVYACTAIYSVFGTETEGEPHVVCEVSRIAPSFVMMIR